MPEPVRAESLPPRIAHPLKPSRSRLSGGRGNECESQNQSQNTYQCMGGLAPTGACVHGHLQPCDIGHKGLESVARLTNHLDDRRFGLPFTLSLCPKGRIHSLYVCV